MAILVDNNLGTGRFAGIVEHGPGGSIQHPLGSKNLFCDTNSRPSGPLSVDHGMDR